MGKMRFTLRAAVYLLLIKDDEVLLSRRFNTGWMDGRYSLVSGHIDGNESISKAMLREAKEEAGIVIKKNDLKPAVAIHRNAGNREYIDFFFVANKWDGEIKIMEQDKCDDLRWFPMEKLPENTVPGLEEAIENYKNHVPFFEFGWEK